MPSPTFVPAAERALLLTQDELNAWGEVFGRSLRAPALVALRGDLGAGKTTLVQAICRGLGVEDEVTSPTYALVHEYRGRTGQVFHLDLYRLEGPHQLENLGFDDILAAGDVVLVEWPERAGDALPGERHDLTLEHVAGDPLRRRVRVA
jgi:tRNA threonylcarbamoyladenosine biosynthesis protein TsaE